MTKPEMLNALKRRADWLAFRVANSGKDLSYDRTELVALNWAIQVLSTLKGL